MKGSIGIFSISVVLLAGLTALAQQGTSAQGTPAQNAPAQSTPAQGGSSQGTPAPGASAGQGGSALVPLVCKSTSSQAGSSQGGATQGGSASGTSGASFGLDGTTQAGGTTQTGGGSTAGGAGQGGSGQGGSGSAGSLSSLGANQVCFMDKAARSSLFEIQSSRLALQKSSSAAIKNYANRMIRDHTQAGNRLRAVAAQYGALPPQTVDTSQQQLLRTLQGMSGKTFDATYLAQQVAAHTQAVALFRAYSQAASAPTQRVQQFAAQTLPVLQQHLQLAQQLQRQAGGASGTSSTGTSASGTSTRGTSSTGTSGGSATGPSSGGAGTSSSGTSGTSSR